MSDIPIDLRSDTVTVPTAGMHQAMMTAKVGDDVFDEDPSVNRLQEHAAALFGKDAALFCPSGTMANQIGIMVHTRPGDEVLCEAGAHVHYYEGGGMATNAGVSVGAITGTRGVFTAEQLQSVIRPHNIHYPKPALVCIENTCNRGGGKVFPLGEIQRIRNVCEKHELKMHLDGARLFNALVRSGETAPETAICFDTVSICLSKGLGAPVGSLLLGDSTTIAEAKRIRKRLGGGMRQAGFLAAAGLYALEHHVERLAEDHQLAEDLETVLNEQPWTEEVLPVETNIIVFRLKQRSWVKGFLSHLDSQGIRALAVDERSIRMVTHLSLPKGSQVRIAEALQSFRPD